MEKIIICFRHGQTDYNALQIFQDNKIDLSLNEEGKKQAVKLRDNLEKMQVIYSSPLKRAIETAEIVNEKLKNHYI